MNVRELPRSLEIDLLKTVSVIGIVIIHTAIYGYTYDIGSFNWTATVFWGSITRASVPVFFMCSGALLLNPNKHLSISRLYSKNFLRLLIALFFWATAYMVFHLLVEGPMSLNYTLSAIKNVLLFNHEQHLYYLHIILLVYVFIPVTRVFVRRASKSELEYFLVVWFILGILYPTIKIFWPFTLLTGIPLQWQINMTYAAIGYGVLGHYLRKYPVLKIYALVLLAAGFVFVFGGTYIMSVKTGVLFQHFFEGMSVGVCLLAIGIFGVIIAAKSKCKGVEAPMAKIFLFLSKASFCIFLVHVFFINIFDQLGLTVHLLPCLISIPLISLFNIIFCITVYYVLFHIPVLNKWII
ncbi:MAG TPA: acyltransferase family protein [Clostridia bacterium]|nr:acyltransferase family protein [Clostridia bacterium]